MPNLNDITNAAGYVGNSALGGFGGKDYDIDTKPLQNLALYALNYRIKQYDQRQIDADEKIKELAALAPYSLMDGIEGDQDAVMDAQAKLEEYSAEYTAKGTPNSPKEKMKQFLEFQQKKKDQIKLISSAHARKIKLDAYVNVTQKDGTLSAEQKELKINNAKALFKPGDVFTLPEIPNNDVATPALPAEIYDKVEYFKEDKDGNMIVNETRDEYSFTGNAKIGYLHGNDLMFPTLPANATPQQKAEYEERKLAFSKSGLGLWKDAGGFLNSALSDANYKKTETTNGINVLGEPPVTKLTDEIDFEKVKASNPLAGGVAQMRDAYNNAILQKIDRLEKMQYESSVTGKKPLFSQGTDTVESLKKLILNEQQPLTPENLVSLAMFEKARPDKVESKLTLTGYGLDRDKMANQLKIEQTQQAGQNKREAQQQAGANYRARLPYIYAKMGNGTATKDEKSDYPVLKTQELVEAIGINGQAVKFTDLTQEQQLKIKAQLGENTNSDLVTVVIENGKIKVSGKVTKKDPKDSKKTVTEDVVININPDDITKAYYDEVNKNDAGKEAPERKYFKFGAAPKADVDEYGVPIKK